MKIHFHLYYSTQFGENLYLITELRKGENVTNREYPLQHLNETLWHEVIDFGSATEGVLEYHYEYRNQYGETKAEWGSRSIDLGLLNSNLAEVYDYWNPPGAVENVFETQPFHLFFKPPSIPRRKKKAAAYTHIFRAKAPLLLPDESLCLLGHGTALRNWDAKAPLLLQPEEGTWSIQVDLSEEDFPLAYKYGVWNTKTKSFAGFEDGGNRALYLPKATKTGAYAPVILHDGTARLPNTAWRGSGVAIPVFSLRSDKGFGVGEFADLPALADWAKSVGMKIIQLLPINDTSATGTWTDSYPYSAVSAFALHPVYLNVAAVAGKAQAKLLKPYAKKQKALNRLEVVDYEAVIEAKWAILRKIYAVQKADFLTNPEFIRYFTENRHWLIPYAAFCYLRDKNGGADFGQWSTHQKYQEKAITKLVSPKSAHYDEVAIHYFVQWHLHCQLKEAVEYVHAQGLALKGDIPIGIYRFSCDAWVAPELYNMDMQSGAPPDDFAVNGQNWGFPTYNWARMKADGFSWWRQRFSQMSVYFDAFRIDHILGFFRIWSIPMHAVEGILGYFVPAIPVTEQEFNDAGIGFNRDRFCLPYINDRILSETFGDTAVDVCMDFLERTPDGGHWSGASQYSFKAEFDTQAKIEAHFKASLQAGVAQTESQASTKQGLFSLLANVVLIDVTPEIAAEKHYAFRIGMEHTTSFEYLPDEVKAPLKALYVDYFYDRQDDFWQREAMEKLPDLKRATNMLICGEDLGMVPHCVPDVMEDLGILSLEIQRMPKKSGSTFFHPKDAPYLSVVTPSTHDMSTLRGWWEEDQEQTQQFFNTVLDYAGAAPYFCEPWINRLLIAQHLNAPAMWAIFQLQDLLGMDGDLRRENPEDERINVPANPKHYWRYRMHLSLGELQKASAFNAALKGLVEDSKRL